LKIQKTLGLRRSSQDPDAPHFISFVGRIQTAADMAAHTPTKAKTCDDWTGDWKAVIATMPAAAAAVHPANPASLRDDIDTFVRIPSELDFALGTSTCWTN